MRISNQQKEKILEAVRKSFGDSAVVYLFGSRADDSKKGGDIDLLIESDIDRAEHFTRMIKAVSGIQRSIGDQKIDMIVSSDVNSDTRVIVREAVRTGIRL
jgi:predicted nucleotidyltransferase